MPDGGYLSKHVLTKHLIAHSNLRHYKFYENVIC